MGSRLGEGNRPWGKNYDGPLPEPPVHGQVQDGLGSGDQSLRLGEEAVINQSGEQGTRI